MTRTLRTLCAAPALAALLSGCVTLAPKYQRPADPTPASWPQGAAYAPTQDGKAADLAWRDFFTDPKLQAVIALALKNNRDLRVSLLNITETRAQYQVQRADLFPAVNASANAVSERSPKGLSSIGSTGATGAAGASATTTGAAAVADGKRDIRIYTAQVGVSAYELDLWGRVRSLTRQAFEQYLASKDAARSARISLISETATDYLTLGADRQKLKVAEDTLKSDDETLSITRARFEHGIVSELDVRQAETAADQARADLLAATTQAAQDLNALNLVVGSSTPDALLPDGQDDSLPTLADVPAGLSSDVLLDRPDVREAEHQLIGDNANIGAARAAFFPTISLTGDTGSESLYLDKLFQPGSGAWTFAPTITLPIFAGGKNIANLKLAKAQRDTAVAQYEYAVQTAFRETADALAQRGTAVREIEAQEDLVKSAGVALKLSQARYQRGVDTYLTLLTAQRTYYTAQQGLVSARLTRASNLVTLYRVLGGGVK
jgi:multidrug efflux system outer membrane protein